MRITALYLLPPLLLLPLVSPRSGPARNPSQRAARLHRLLGRMTLEEKVSLLAGLDGGQTRPVPRLGIPSLRVTDGPLGVGWGVPAVAFPCGTAMASTWNPDLIRRMAEALAEETRAAGRHLLLGPCVNIVRTPLWGRTFETFSEDPYLAGVIGAAYVRGLQSRGIGAAVKHYACNNQEYQRTRISVEVDERALREIYLRAFEIVVRQSHPWMVMAAYNRVRGKYCCANRHLLLDILKGEWQYDGVVVSDWGAAHDTVGSALAGLDLEMPGPGRYFGPALLQAVRQGRVPVATVNDKAYRMLRLLDRAGLLQKTAAPAPAMLNDPAHRAAARRVAEEGIVLLKNERNVLPLDPARIRTLAVIGPNADAVRLGGGSSRVTPARFVTPLQGLREYCRDRIAIRYLEGCPLTPSLHAVPSALLYPRAGDARHGLHAEYFANPRLEGRPAMTRTDLRVDFDWGGGPPTPGLTADGFSVRWTGILVPTNSGDYEFGVISDDGCRIWIDDRLVVDYWMDQGAVPRTAPFRFLQGRPYRLRVEYYENRGRAVVRLGWTRRDLETIRAAADLARSCDAAVLFIGLSGAFDTEGSDRNGLELPGAQDSLVRAVAAANPRTIVVLVAGSPVSVEKWIDSVPAVLCAWYPGSEGGRAIARILFGEVNPSGKLPLTFPRRLEDTPAWSNYPGRHGRVLYREGVFVGYRYYDTFRIPPRFPFGHGLSYTVFEFGAPRVTPGPSSHGLPLVVSLPVSNRGPRAGAEVVQLYVSEVSPPVKRPSKELKAFRKVFLEPGGSTSVVFRLDASAFSHWDPALGRWRIDPGEYRILIGSSSADIRRTAICRWDARRGFRSPQTER